MATEYTYTIGRRKTASATVRLYASEGVSEINGKPFEKFYVSALDKSKVLEPFKVADLKAKDFYFTSKVVGGGKSAQLEAIRLGIARAIVKLMPEKRVELKKQGLLKRDPRMVERKKTGLHKARKAEQYSKR